VSEPLMTLRYSYAALMARNSAALGPGAEERKANPLFGVRGERTPQVPELRGRPTQSHLDGAERGNPDGVRAYPVGRR
jgi:hypothetical protein